MQQALGAVPRDGSARATLAFVRVMIDELESGSRLEDIIAHDEVDFIAKVRATILATPLLPAEVASTIGQCLLQIEQYVYPHMNWDASERTRTARAMCAVLLDAVRAENDPVFHLVRHKFYEAAFFSVNNALHHLFDLVATLEALLDSTQETDSPIGRG